MINHPPFHPDTKAVTDGRAHTIGDTGPTLREITEQIDTRMVRWVVMHLRVFVAIAADSTETLRVTAGEMANAVTHRAEAPRGVDRGTHADLAAARLDTADARARYVSCLLLHILV